MVCLHQKLAILGMSKSRIGVDGKCLLKLLFCFGRVLISQVKARQTQIRFDPFWIYLDGFVQFCEGLVLLVLVEKNTPHQDVTLNVVGVFLQYFPRYLLSHPDNVRLSLAHLKINVAEADSSIEIICIKFNGSL